MRRRLALAPMAAAALLAGCDDDGASPFAPGRDLAGTWVRYLPTDRQVRPDVAFAAFADTLFLDADGSGTWSVMIPNMGPIPGRVVQDVYVERGGLVMRMWAMPASCEACIGMDAFRQAPANWALVRKGDHRIELRLRRIPGLEEDHAGASLGEDVYHYARHAPGIPVPD